MPTKTKKSEITEPVVQQTVEPPANTEDYITFKRSHFYSVLVMLAFAVGILTGITWERYTSSKSVAANPQNVAQNTGPVVGDVIASPTAPQYVRYDIPTEGFPSLGPEDAPITIVEF